MRRNICIIAMISAPSLLIGCVPVPPQRACINFENPLVVGQNFGAPAGDAPGDVVITKNGIEISVEGLTLFNGAQTFGVAYIDSQLVPTGSGQSLRSNNINLVFDFRNVGFSVSRVTLEFDDFGGSENITVNGMPVPPVLELASQPLPPNIGGVAARAQVTDVPVSLANPTIKNRHGSLELIGAIQSFMIGGQELWIDEVCAEG